MKPELALICAVAFSLSGFCRAAVVQTPGRIQVEGIIDGGIVAPDVTGDTLDYLKFELLTTSEVTVAGFEFSSDDRLMLAQYIGKDDEFGFIGSPYSILGSNGPQSFTRTLNAGTYVLAMGAALHTSYDIFDGFQAVNPEGGGFTIAPYSYSISGDVRALEFWDGELDGTFKITTIPEPSGVLLLAVAGLRRFMVRRRK